VRSAGLLPRAYAAIRIPSVAADNEIRGTLIKVLIRSPADVGVATAQKRRSTPSTTWS